VKISCGKKKLLDGKIYKDDKKPAAQKKTEKSPVKVGGGGEYFTKTFFVDLKYLLR
jgi:hypothetical protein